jgi:hypothetical protein
LFDVEQRELSQSEVFRVIEERAEQEQRPGVDHIHQQEASGSKALPLCISDDTDTSRDSALSPGEDMKDLELTYETADAAAADDGLRVEQLLGQLNGQDNDIDQQNHNQAYNLNPPEESRVSPLRRPFRLIFDSSSIHNMAPRLESPIPIPPRNDAREATDQFQRGSLSFQVEKADNPASKFVDVHAAVPDQSKCQDTNEALQPNVSTDDHDTPWRKLFSIASSHSAFSIDEVDAKEDIASGIDNPRSSNASLGTTRDPEISTLRLAQSLHDVESSVFICPSPTASLRNITSLAERLSRKLTEEPTHSDPDEFWRKFVFDNEENDSTIDSPRQADSPPPRPVPRSSLYVGLASTHVGPASTSMSGKALPSTPSNSIFSQNGSAKEFEFPTSHSRPVAAQPAVSAWSTPEQSNRSAKDNLTSKIKHEKQH